MRLIQIEVGQIRKGDTILTNDTLGKVTEMTKDYSDNWQVEYEDITTGNKEMVTEYNTKYVKLVIL